MSPRRARAPVVVVQRSAWDRALHFIANEAELGTLEGGSIDLNPDGRGRFSIILFDGSSPPLPGVTQEPDELDDYGAEADADDPTTRT